MEVYLEAKLQEATQMLDSMFVAKSVSVKVKPKKGASEADQELDERGYKEESSTGVIIFSHNIALVLKLFKYLDFILQ